MVVMVYEIIGSRLLSPYIGGSIYIWTSLIGVILGSLSLGYWFGGRMADTRSEVRILASIIFAAAGAISVTTLIKDIFLSMLAATAMLLEVKALIAALILFAPASVLLGMVTPYAAKLKMHSLDATGRTVGNLYALSTVGSIVGTFAAGFFLVPFVGSVRTLYLISAILFAVSIILWPLRFSQLNIAGFLVFVLGVSTSEYTREFEYRSTELIDIDTEYSRVQVARSVDPLTNKPIRMYATDPYFAQSAMFFDSDDLVFQYARFFDLIGHFNPHLNNTLLIGSGAFNYPKHYLAKFPAAKMDVVEIDPKAEEIAKFYFRWTENDRVKVIAKDGREFLNTSEPQRYDAVLLDAFGSLFSVPYQLATLEAVQRMHDVLKRDGVVIANLGTAITGEGGQFLAAEVATYRQVFPQVVLFKVRADKCDTDVQNVILVALRSQTLAELTSDEPETDALLKHIVTGTITSEEPILTDDLAPIEYYNSIAQRRFLTLYHSMH